MVAAIILTSVFLTLEAPTLMNSPVSRTLRSLTCVGRGSSATYAAADVQGGSAAVGGRAEGGA